MNKQEINEFIEKMEEVGDVWTEEQVNDVYGDSSFEEALADRQWMCPHGEDHFRARVSVAVSSQFFGWITGIGFGMRIVGPEDVRQQYKEYLQSVIQNYMD